MKISPNLTALLARINRNRNKPLTVAARTNDAGASGDLKNTVEALGVDFDNAAYLIEQRMMRVQTFIESKGAKLDEPALVALRMAYFDALVIGWVGRHMQDAGVPDELRIKDPITMEQFIEWYGRGGQP